LSHHTFTGGQADVVDLRKGFFLHRQQLLAQARAAAAVEPVWHHRAPRRAARARGVGAGRGAESWAQEQL